MLCWFVVAGIVRWTHREWEDFQSFLLCKERFQEAECQDGSALSLSLSPAPVLFICVFFMFSIFIADVGQGSVCIHPDTC